MNRLSLRSRLTFSYGIVSAVVLILGGLGIVAIVASLLIRHEAIAIDDTVAAARATVALHWSSTDDDIAALVRAQPQASGVRVLGPRGFGPGLPFGRPPGPASLAGPGPRPGGFGPRPGEPGPPPFDARTLTAIFGLRPQAIGLHRSELLISPDNDLVGTLLRFFALAVAAVIALAVVLGWLIARWLANQALAPLGRVTAELTRFAGGDFSSRPVRIDDRTELGALTTAYNGAVAQVAAAFSEREETELHLRLLLGEASHEMRTPLTVISAYLETLEGDALDAAARKQAFLTLHGETARLRRLTDRVLALARLDAADREEPGPLDVLDVLRDTIDEVTAARGGSISVSADDEYAIVRAHPWEMREALGNLVENAVKYGAGTPVDVGVTHADDRVEIRVTNGGPGIAAGERQHLFRHFFRGEAATGIDGTGLGLAIVLRAAVRLGGSIVLETNAPGARTTFLLTLPRFAGATSASP